MVAPHSRDIHLHRRLRRPAAPLLGAMIVLGAATTAPPAPAAAAAGPAPVVRSTTPGPSTVPAFYNPPEPLPSAAPGTLIRIERIVGVPGFPHDATLWRVLYHSHNISGHDIAVSGYIAVPTSRPPPGGRPIIAWAHGTTGTARICAPSLFSNAPDASGIYLAPDLDQYIAAGYVVAATDYQGLGAPGVHPYLVGQAEGQDVLDAARAALRLPGADASHTVVIVGHSQGGQAALFAGQLAAVYAPGLRVVGTVAIAPLTETAEALPLAVQVNETALLATAAYAWAHTYSDLPMDALFRPAEIPTVDRLMSSTCENQVSAALAKIPSSSLLKPGFASDPALKAHLEQNSPGAVHTDSPIFLLQGTADTTIPDVLAEQFEEQQCPAVGDDLELRLYPGADHGTILTASASDMLSWIAERFAGAPLVGTGCSQTTVG